MDIDSIRLWATVASIACGTIFPAISIGWIGSTSVKAIGRNPEAGSKVQTMAILAIAFAESTLGKNCADNNCSNIGVKPGAPSWRSYASYSAWVVDFNRLLDKKYKDWTLEQMCGVYVKPCNPNWLLATKQILTALDQADIK